MKALWFAMVMVMVFLTAACSTSRQPVLTAEYAAVPREDLRLTLELLQEQEVQAGNRKAATREAFETLQRTYRDAGDEEKPEVLIRLTEAEAIYQDAQQEHLQVKRELRWAQKALLQKLLAQAPAYQEPLPSLESLPAPVESAPAEEP